MCHGAVGGARRAISRPFLEFPQLAPIVNGRVIVGAKPSIRGTTTMTPVTRLLGTLAAVVMLVPLAGLAGGRVSLDGYAEFRAGDLLIVEGQRVRLAPNGRFEGEGVARTFQTLPLGYEVQAEGERLATGVVRATKVEAKPNGDAMFEADLVQAFNQIEAEYREKGTVFQQGPDGRVERIGRLVRKGRRVDRARRIAADLTPPYLPLSDFRVYVVENDEWNAMAAPNGSIYVFSGLLDDMNDDEVAIVVGHELVHATHEHARRQFRRRMFTQLALLGVLSAVDTIDSRAQRTIAGVATMLGMSAWTNGYGRSHEDQADVVGLRYVHEAGYDPRVGPRLWERFAERYGDQNRVANFFFGSHSVAQARARNLREEIAINYDPVRGTARR